MGISANTVSYFSAVVAVVASGLFLFNSFITHILGAFLIKVWLLLDCVDGNLARGVKKQPFGGFADGISSYLLVGLSCTTIGVATYFEGGLLVQTGNPWVILMSALASSSDSLMRLVYQKYKNTERDLAEEGLEIIDLGETAEIWADKCLKSKKKCIDADRLVEKAGFDITKQSVPEKFYLSDLIRSFGYDIRLQAQKLEKIYEKLYSKVSAS